MLPLVETDKLYDAEVLTEAERLLDAVDDGESDKLLEIEVLSLKL
jgi:hypothetical protein